MEIIVFLSVAIAVLAVLTSIFLVRRVKKQIAEMTDALVDVKNGNGNRRILSATNELVSPLAYEINEIVVSYESRLSIVRQTEETNRQLMTSLSHDVRTPLVFGVSQFQCHRPELLVGGEVFYQQRHIPKAAFCVFQGGSRRVVCRADLGQPAFQALIAVDLVFCDEV